jgi:hypothetical protein
MAGSLISDEAGMIWKETVLVYICGVPPRHLAGGTKENHEELKSGYCVPLEFKYRALPVDQPLP